jgi:hypothetical protein
MDSLVRAPLEAEISESDAILDAGTSESAAILESAAMLGSGSVLSAAPTRPDPTRDRGLSAMPGSALPFRPLTSPRLPL